MNSSTPPPCPNIESWCTNMWTLASSLWSKSENWDSFLCPRYSKRQSLLLFDTLKLEEPTSWLRFKSCITTNGSKSERNDKTFYNQRMPYNFRLQKFLNLGIKVRKIHAFESWFSYLKKSLDFLLFYFLDILFINDKEITSINEVFYWPHQ